MDKPPSRAGQYMFSRSLPPRSIIEGQYLSATSFFFAVEIHLNFLHQWFCQVTKLITEWPQFDFVWPPGSITELRCSWTQMISNLLQISNTENCICSFIAELLPAYVL